MPYGFIWMACSNSLTLSDTTVYHHRGTGHTPYGKVVTLSLVDMTYVGPIAVTGNINMLSIGRVVWFPYLLVIV